MIGETGGAGAPDRHDLNARLHLPNIARDLIDELRNLVVRPHGRRFSMGSISHDINLTKHAYPV